MNKLPEPYRSRILHNMRVCHETHPGYFWEVINLCRIQVWILSGWNNGVEFWPEATHYFFNEEPK